jgi:hypothetical protein
MPLMFCNASKMLGLGFFLKKAGEYTSTGTGLSIRLTALSVPVITTSSRFLSAALTQCQLIKAALRKQ